MSSSAIYFETASPSNPVKGVHMDWRDLPLKTEMTIEADLRAVLPVTNSYINAVVSIDKVGPMLNRLQDHPYIFLDYVAGFSQQLRANLILEHLCLPVLTQDGQIFVLPDKMFHLAYAITNKIDVTFSTAYANMAESVFGERFINSLRRFWLESEAVIVDGRRVQTTTTEMAAAIILSGNLQITDLGEVFDSLEKFALRLHERKTMPIDSQDQVDLNKLLKLAIDFLSFKVHGKTCDREGLVTREEGKALRKYLKSLSAFSGLEELVILDTKTWLAPEILEEFGVNDVLRR